MTKEEINLEQHPIEESSPWYKIPTDERYYAYLDTIDLPPTKKKRREYHQRPLRDTPVEIPLESTTPQKDPWLEEKKEDKDKDKENERITENIANELEAAINRMQEFLTEEESQTLGNAIAQVEDYTSTLEGDITETVIEGVPEDKENNDMYINQDIVELELDDWLTIDSTGITTPMEDLIPPDDDFNLIDYLDL